MPNFVLFFASYISTFRMYAFRWLGNELKSASDY